MGSVTIAELLSWKPGDLGDVADQLNKSRKTLVDLQDEIDATKPPADWHSDAGNAARSAHTTLKLDLNDMTAEVAKVVLGLDVASTNLTTAKSDLQGQLDHARTLKCVVDHESGQVSPPSEEDDPDGEVTQAQVNALAQGISEALTDAANADADLAAVLKAAQKDQIDGGTGSLADANALTVALAGTGAKEEYYKQTLGKMSAEEQEQWIKDHVDDLPPEAAAVVKSEVQEYYAREVAKRIEDPDSIDRGTVNVMKFLQGQQPFAHQLYTDASPDEIADAVKHLNDDAYPDVGGVNGGQDQKDLYKDFVNSAGYAAATYSKGTGAYAPPDDLAQRWFDEITDDDNEENAAALTLLLRSGGHQTSFDSDFIRDVSGKVYEWERSADGDAVWGPRSEGIMDPNAKVDLSIDAKSGLIDYKSGFATDGLSNVLGAMEHNPEAAQDFFRGQYDGATESLHDKMEYLLGGEDARTFALDDGSDDGEGLGRALQAATVGQDTRTPEGNEVTNELFKTIAEHSGEDSGIDSHLPGNNTWHVWNGMTDHLGTIASGYTGDVYDVLNGSSPDQLTVSPDQLEKVLGEIGHGDDKTGLETLTAAMHMETRNQNVEYLAGLSGPHTLDQVAASGFHGMQMQHGDVMGKLLDQGLATSEDEDKTEAARAALLSKGLDIAGGFVPGAGTVLGDGASELSKMTFDTVKGEALSRLSEGVAGSESSTTESFRSDAIASVPDKLQYGAVSDLYRAGFLGGQDLSGGDGHFGGAPDSIFSGDPATIRPELIDKDGYVLDGTDIPESDRAGIIRDWDSFKESPAFKHAYEESYTSNFYDQVVKGQ